VPIGLQSLASRKHERKHEHKHDHKHKHDHDDYSIDHLVFIFGDSDSHSHENHKPTAKPPQKNDQCNFVEGGYFEFIAALCPKSCKACDQKFDLQKIVDKLTAATCAGGQPQPTIAKPVTTKAPLTPSTKKPLKPSTQKPWKPLIEKPWQPPQWARPVETNWPQWMNMDKEESRSREKHGKPQWLNIGDSEEKSWSREKYGKNKGKGWH